MRLGTFALLERWILMRFESRDLPISMRRRLDSARQGFQRLRARSFERGHAAGEEVPRDAFEHVRVAGTLDFDAVWIPNLFDLDAETAQLHKHGSIDCVRASSCKGAGTDATARRVKTLNAFRCGAASPFDAQ